MGSQGMLGFGRRITIITIKVESISNKFFKGLGKKRY